MSGGVKHSPKTNQAPPVFVQDASTPGRNKRKKDSPAGSPTTDSRDLLNEMDKRFKEWEERFDKKIDVAMEKVVKRFEEIERRLDSQQEWIGQVEDSLRKKIEKIEEREESAKCVNPICTANGTYTEELKSLKDQLARQQKRVSELHNSMPAMCWLTEMKDQLQSIEDERKKNNLIIHGIPKTAVGNTENSMVIATEFLTTKLQLNIQLKEARRLGKSDNAPLLICLQEERDKYTIFKNCNKLKNSGISVKEDLSKTTRLERRRQLETFKELRAAGNKVYFRGPNLIVNGKLYQN